MQRIFKKTIQKIFEMIKERYIFLKKNNFVFFNSNAKFREIREILNKEKYLEKFLINLKILQFATLANIDKYMYNIILINIHSYN